MTKGKNYLQSGENNVLNFFIDRFRVTILLGLVILIGGTMSYLSIAKDLRPEVEVGAALVMTTYPGASPDDMETLVVDELEDQLKSISGVKDYTSTAGGGYATTIVEFVEGTDMNEAMNDVRDKVDRAKNKLPDDANDPTITRINTSSTTILTLAMYGDYEPKYVRYYAQKLQDEIERMPNIQDVVITGAPAERVEIVLNPFILLGNGLSVSSVVQAISSQHQNYPIGDVDTGNYELSYRIEGMFNENNLEELLEVPLRADENTGVLTIGDLGRVQNGYEKETSYSRFWYKGDDKPYSTVAITITKGTGGNIMEIAQDIKDKVDEMRPEFPSDLNVEVAQDYSLLIEDQFRILGQSGVQTIALVFIVLFFFIGWKQAAIASATVPFSMMFGVIGMLLFGYSLNGISLFALILTLGILVDNGIVVQEGVYHYLAQGLDGKTAAKLAVRDFKWPIVSGTLTTIFAFLPMTLAGGVMGQFIRVIPITVSIVLLGSLITALVINASISAAFLRAHKEGDDDLTKIEKFEKKINLGSLLYRVLGPIYKKTVSFLLDRKKTRRFIIFPAVFLVFLMAMALPATGILSVAMFTASDDDYFNIKYELDPGRILDDTDEITLAIQDEIMKIGEVKSFISYTGSNAGGGSGSMMAGGLSDNPYMGSMQVNLFSKLEGRERNVQTIVDEARAATQYLVNDYNAQVTYVISSGGPPSGSPVEIQIYGEEMDTLNSVASDFQNILQDVPGSVDVANDIAKGKGQFTFKIDRQKVAQFGITLGAVYQTLYAGIDGVNSVEIYRDGEKQDITVVYDTKIADMNDILNYNFQTSVGNVPFGEFVTPVFEVDYISISHKDGDKKVSVTSDVSGDYTSTQVLNGFKEKLAEMDYGMPAGYTYKFGGDSEDIADSFTDMARASVIGMILILFVLVTQFDSFKQPLAIMLTIPLSLIGVFFGLTMIGLPLTFPAIIGIVALMGIVVNDAIILIDTINSKRRLDGMGLRDAIVDSGYGRMQPILLTTFTTVFGVLPLAFADPTWAPLSWSIAFGLMLTTFLTLLFIPMIYLELEEKNELKRLAEKAEEIPVETGVETPEFKA